MDMIGEKAWGWDLNEMRNVGTNIHNHTTEDQPSDFGRVACFTPINRPQNDLDGSAEVSTRTKASGKRLLSGKSWHTDGGTGGKTRQIQAETSTKWRDKQSTAASRKRRKRADEAQHDDIAKVLPRIKPKQKASANSRQKSKQNVSDNNPPQDGSRDIANNAKTDGEHLGYSIDEERRPSVVASRVTDNTKALYRNEQIPITNASPTMGLSVRTNATDYIDPKVVMLARDNLKPPQSAQRSIKRGSESESETGESAHSCELARLSEIKISQEADTYDYEPLFDSDGGLKGTMLALPRRSNVNIVDHGPQAQDLSDDDLFADIVDDDLPEWLGDPPLSTTAKALQQGHGFFPSSRPSTSEVSALHSSDILNHISGNAVKAKTSHIIELAGSENEYPDSDLDTSFIDLTASDDIQATTPLTSPQRPTTPKLQWLPPKIFAKTKSPHLPHSLDFLHKVPLNANGKPISFLRPAFPKPVLDRSPILGLTNRTVLRTCFRIGKALNAAFAATRTNTDAIIELYARVVSSSRNGYKQYFQFADLFTDKPPYLGGVYGLWKGVGLWEQDSRVFLGEEGRGKMCRVLGRVKMGERGRGREMSILCVWECGWEDVGIAKGIVCSY
ncbi:MAG: hypothetical protein Q9164_005221 [Protoblastenia rupestris]